MVERGDDDGDDSTSLLGNLYDSDGDVGKSFDAF